ncbi:MAG TPA: hypothetical protein VNS88_05075 [Nitrospiraceae bacterium]|nr:hypothetical protein [Nitrospiraceae bacterium]
MAVGWGQFDDPDDEPATPSTLFIISGVGVDPANAGTVAYASIEIEPVPYERPDELQPGVIEPTAVYRKTGVIRYDVQSG